MSVAKHGCTVADSAFDRERERENEREESDNCYRARGHGFRIDGKFAFCKPNDIVSSIRKGSCADHLSLRKHARIARRPTLQPDHYINVGGSYPYDNW